MGSEAADGLADPEQMCVAFRYLWRQFRCRRAGRIAHTRHLRQHRTHALDPTPADVDLAEQQVGEDAQHRQRDDHDHPGNA